jgi:probable F420-dependent oxidoreductase
MSTRLKFGLLLPHFCAYASAEKCLDGARRAEAYGFDSVWARDHLVFTPHASEGGDNTHLESLILLSAVAAVTHRLSLGTAMTICHRHPIHLAQAVAGLSAIAQGRVILGVGLGGFAHEFAAVGLPTALQDRARLARINVEICRKLWAGEVVSHKSDFFVFDNVSLRPVPKQRIPVWIGGSTPASCRRAVEIGDGWMPARITFATFAKRIEYLRLLCRQAQKPMVQAAVMPFTSVGSDRNSALRGLNVQALIDEARSVSTWVKPASGTFSNLEDIGGMILAGSPADIIQGSRAYEAAGADHIVYDLRLRFDDWYEQIGLLGEEVLPALREEVNSEV